MSNGNKSSKRRRSFINPSIILRRHTVALNSGSHHSRSLSAQNGAVGASISSDDNSTTSLDRTDGSAGEPSGTTAHARTNPADAAAAQDADSTTTERRVEMMLDRNQRATIAAMAELRSAVQELTRAVRSSSTDTSRGGTATTDLGRRRSIFRGPAVSSQVDPAITAAAADDGVDRKQVRLDGLEVYAVVSAVTAGTLVAVFDSYQPGDVGDMFHEGRYLEVLMAVAFLVTGTIGIVSSLHCIFVFSLITMYGRTAIGMERDDALEEFFAGTGMQRFRGFQSFVRSLYALMGELIVVITSKVSKRPGVHLIALCVTVTLMYYVYQDTEVIMEKAGVIFAPLPGLRRVASNLTIGASETVDKKKEEKVDDTRDKEEKVTHRF